MGMFVNEGVNQVLKRIIAEPRPSRSWYKVIFLVIHLHICFRVIDLIYVFKLT